MKDLKWKGGNLTISKLVDGTKEIRKDFHFLVIPQGYKKINGLSGDITRESGVSDELPLLKHGERGSPL